MTRIITKLRSSNFQSVMREIQEILLIDGLIKNLKSGSFSKEVVMLFLPQIEEALQKTSNRGLLVSPVL